MKGVFSFVSGLIFILGFVPYIKAIVQRKIRPAKASWLIWAFLDTIILAGMAVEGSVNGLIVGATSGGWIVCIFALKYGQAGWTKLDQLCLFGAALGIFLWLAFNDPVIGIVAVLSVSLLGSVPTFLSAWHDPSREDKTGWTLFWLSCILAIAAISEWTLAEAAQPMTFFLIETVMMYILFIRPIFMRGSFKPE